MCATDWASSTVAIRLDRTVITSESDRSESTVATLSRGSVLTSESSVDARVRTSPAAVAKLGYAYGSGPYGGNPGEVGGLSAALLARAHYAGAKPLPWYSGPPLAAIV